MELPSELKKLYRHWDLHTVSETDPLLPIQILKNEKLFQDINWFIKERIDIWKKKISGEMPPYTKDPILSRYRFCNIFREFDRQTIEFSEDIAETISGKDGILRIRRHFAGNLLLPNIDPFFYEPIYILKKFFVLKNLYW